MRGNVTTVNRIAASLREAGAEIIVLPVDTLTIDDITAQLRSFAPQVIHGFHALFCGEISRNLSLALSIPFVITLTGSDINDTAMREHPATISALKAAAGIACFDTSIAATVCQHFPDTENRLYVVPQGVSPPPVTGTHDFGLPADRQLILLPAALRPVKNVDFPVRALSGLLTGNRPPMFVIAGGEIDRDYAAGIRQQISRIPSVVWLGEVPYEQMGDLYARADIVLNCSCFEGMPNSLMEAMVLGRTVLAADIPGNSLLVRNNETGLLYRNEPEFIELVNRLLDDNTLRERLGAAAASFVREHYQPHREAEGYLKLYQNVLKHGSSPL
jgi:glycosyltransferase involved in cell wall biosynthesis